jgi:hypothetical protein
VGAGHSDRESLQGAVRLTIERGDDLAFYFATGWDASSSGGWDDVFGEHSLAARALSKVADFVKSSPRINHVGTRGLMRGQLDFRSREARYRNGSGPWRRARGGEVLTASEDGDVEGLPRVEPSPFDVIDAVEAMEIEQTLEDRALGLQCTLYEGWAYAQAHAGAKEASPPDHWRTDRPLTCSVWVDKASLLRQIKITAMSTLHGRAVGTDMMLELRSDPDVDP